MAFLIRLACAALCLLPVLASPAAAKDTYVSTPAGRMRSDCVHRVPSGSLASEDPSGSGQLHVHDAATGTFLRVIPRCDDQEARPLFERDLLARQARAQQDASESKPRIVLAEEDAVAVPATAGSSSSPGRHLLQFPSDYDGWEAYTEWYNADGIDVFLGNFSVPDEPKDVPDILYIFTGLQNVDWIPKVDPEVAGFDIIQPVLQYPSDDGEGWSVKSWYVSLDNGALQSDELRVKVGDAIFGNLTQVGLTSTEGKWFIGSQSVATGRSTDLTVARPRLRAQPWAYNTLECYGCAGCTTYPQQPCRFTNLQLSYKGRKLTPQWNLNPKPAKKFQCAETIAVLTPSAQNIVFQKA